MIYIFKGIQSICSLPGMACKACGECCAQMNCNWIKDLCNGCGSAVTHFFERPLSTYVVISIVECSLLIYTAYLAMDKAEAEKCKYEGPLGGATYTYMQMGVSVVCIIFAFYFQRAVWGKIIDKVREDMGATTEALVGDKADKVVIKKSTVQDAFKNIFCEDFFVLGYFVLLAGNAGLSQVTRTPKCTGFVEPYGVFIPELMFFVFGCYCTCYYCCECCANKVEIDKLEAESGNPVE